MHTFSTLGRWSERAAYYLDIVLYPVLAIVLAGLTARTWSWAAWCALGIAAFTLAEYSTHRWVLHWVFWHGTHERHHKHPEEFVIFPIYYVPSLFLALYFIVPLPFFAGVCLGWSWFVAWHHALHHWDLAGHPLIRRYAAWHDLHHHSIGCNYGITHPLWDVVFGTYRGAAR